MSHLPKLAICVGAWSSPCDRFLKEGYREAIPFEKVLAQSANIPGVKGVELSYPGSINEENLDRVTRLLKGYGLEVVCIASSISSTRRWVDGSFTARDEKTRREAIENTKRTMALAGELGALARQWFGQDGYDYHFTGDPRHAWEYLADGLRECGEAHPGVRLAIEYKSREPKRWSYVSSAAVALLLAQETGCANIGVCLDLGHAKLAGENYADALTLTQRYNRHFHVHLNENYGITDDDMAVGSVHFMELVEFIYWLKKTGYEGWFSSDVWPVTDDPLGCTMQSMGFFQDLWSMVDRIGLDVLGGCIEQRDYPQAMAAIRKELFHQ